MKRLGGLAFLALGMLQLVLSPATSVAQKSSRPASSSQTTSIETGSISGGVYRNSVFGFSCKIPFGWVDRTEQMRVDDAPQPGEPAKSLVLLAVFERPPEAGGRTINSAIVIAVENTSQYVELKTAADYFGPITQVATARGFKVVNEPYEFPVGVKQLVRGDFSKPFGPLTMVQSSLATLEKGYVVSFTFIGGNEDEISSLIANLSFATKKPSSPARK